MTNQEILQRFDKYVETIGVITSQDASDFFLKHLEAKDTEIKQALTRLSEVKKQVV
jgi:DNA polymerase III delta subunit